MPPLTHAALGGAAAPPGLRRSGSTSGRCRQPRARRTAPTRPRPSAEARTASRQSVRSCGNSCAEFVWVSALLLAFMCSFAKACLLASSHARRHAYPWCLDFLVCHRERGRAVVSTFSRPDLVDRGPPSGGSVALNMFLHSVSVRPAILSQSPAFPSRSCSFGERAGEGFVTRYLMWFLGGRCLRFVRFDRPWPLGSPHRCAAC